MAAVPELSQIDRLWIKKALQTQRQAVQRSRLRELPGSEVDQLRIKELAVLDALLGRF